MAWVAVDKDRTEKIFSSIPVRREEITRGLVGYIRNMVRGAYTKNDYKKWACMWSTDANDPLPECAIKLPKGTIKKLIGRDLSWQDEPVELKEE